MIEKQMKLSLPGGFVIGATLAYENQEMPPSTLIMLVPGSGPADRDGNMKGMATQLYRELSNELVQAGYAVFRYDKIGIGESEGDFHTAGLYEQLDCLKQLVDRMRDQDQHGFKKLILLGHSEGTILATLIADQARVEGIILLAGGGSTLKTVMTAQNEALIAELSTKTGLTGFVLKKLLPPEKLRQKQALLFDQVTQSAEDTLKVSGQLIQVKWLREHLTLTDDEILDKLASLKCCVLAIQGSKDVQASMETFDRLSRLHLPLVQTTMIRDMNHMLKIQTEDMSLLSLKKIYKSNRYMPISKDLVAVMKSWLEGGRYV